MGSVPFIQTGTVTGAASLLNVSQPAVSQLMTEMKVAVGFALFDRRGGRLERKPASLPGALAVLLNLQYSIGSSFARRVRSSGRSAGRSTRTPGENEP
jgi:DNA-binding transcriptional LysR family regulator